MERVYSQYGTGELEINGVQHLAGPQPLSQIPDDVVEMLKADPSIERVVVCKKKDGRKAWVVYSPMMDNTAPAEQKAEQPA